MKATRLNDIENLLEEQNTLQRKTLKRSKVYIKMRKPAAWKYR